MNHHNFNNLSIYIHWPFCLSLCPYCDFNSHVSESIDHDVWVSSYIKELEYFLPLIQGAKIPSIFFGGGTPSLMNPKIVERIINFLNKHAVLENAEITLEANPTSIEEAKFKSFKEAGINRLSVGVQSFNNEDLKILGRKHDSKQAIIALETTKAIFDNYSFDLIYARPNQTLKDWEKELSQALALSSNHISLYQLTIEKGTPFFKLFRDGKLELPDQELSADLFDLTNQMLTSNSYNRYEISNYAKPGYECKHNLVYWQYGDYLGIGPGAHSRLGGRAIMMSHNPKKWLDLVNQQGHGIQTDRKLIKEDIIAEFVMMGLRNDRGIEEVDFINKTGSNFADSLNLDYVWLIEKEGLVVFDESSSRIALTQKGMNLHSYLVPRITR